MMCARNLDGTPCNSYHSGGPLYDSEHNVLVGILSRRKNCNDASIVPLVYSRISSQEVVSVLFSFATRKGMVSFSFVDR